MTQILTFDKKQLNGFGLEYISYSALKMYHCSMSQFIKYYILKDYDIVKGPAQIEGDSMHHGLYYFNTQKMNGDGDIIRLEDIQEVAIEHMKKLIEKEQIDRGKTGSIEKSQANIIIGLENAWKNLGNYEVIDCEKSIIQTIKDLDGNELPLPIKGIIDGVFNTIEDTENYYLEDYKFISQFSEDGKINGDYELQAGCYFLLSREEYGKEPTHMIFREIMRGKSSAGQGLLQADLRKLCEGNNIDREKGNNGKYMTNDLMKFHLEEKGILEKAKEVKEYIVDYKKLDYRPVKAFIEFYKRALQDFGLRNLYDVAELVNINDFYNGEENYNFLINNL